MDLYKKRLASRINPSLLLWINLQNTWTLKLNNINQIKSKWNYLQKIIKGPASLSMAHDRNVCTLRLIKTKGVFHFTNIILILGITYYIVHKFLLGPSKLPSLPVNVGLGRKWQTLPRTLPAPLKMEALILTGKYWTSLKILAKYYIIPGNSYWRGRPRTVDLLIVVACFVKMVNTIFNVKRSWTKLVSLPFQWDFPVECTINIFSQS